MLNDQRQLYMQEILSKPGTDQLPLPEQVLYETCIEESSDPSHPYFAVTKARYQWSEIDRDFMCERPESERCSTLEKAKQKYLETLKALKAQGFTESDMELL